MSLDVLELGLSTSMYVLYMGYILLVIQLSDIMFGGEARWQCGTEVGQQSRVHIRPFSSQWQTLSVPRWLLHGTARYRGPASERGKKYKNTFKNP
jgi:hypothetical protein